MRLPPWMYEYLAGIRPDPSAPGYRRIVLKPVPLAGIDFVRAWRQTMAGRIESRWYRSKGKLAWEISIPAGATATVYFPTTDPARITECGKPAANVTGMRFLRQDGDTVVYEVESGRYSFRLINELQ